MSYPTPYWNRVSQAFNENAEDYDLWFAQNKIFTTELAALQAVGTDLGQPRLELGVGPGHFATALEITFGIDPALAPLKLAKKRNVRVCNAIAEKLPFLSGSFRTTYLLFTDCFLEKPTEAFKECRRVLSCNGHIVIGMVPAPSPWGLLLSEKGTKGHPMYRHACFNSIEKIQEMLLHNGFKTVEIISSLLNPPEVRELSGEYVRGYVETAGFVVLVAEKIK